jgi:hypothetical protein
MRAGRRGDRPRRARSGAAIALVLVTAAGCTLAACSSDDGDAGRGAATTTTAPSAETRGATVAQPAVAVIADDVGDGPFLADPETVENADYVEKEYTFAGEATAYRPDGPLAANGRWKVTPGRKMPYRSRILVRYPSDPEAFDGNVFVEWFNVTGGIDVDVAFGLGAPAITDAGSAYVGVSAQQVGVEGGGSAIEIEGAPEISGLEQIDPARYADLEHPGDQYSYDIFSQAAQAVRRPGATNVLGGLVPEHVIAFGESQSAGRLVTYVNAVHPVADIYDGFLIHSRGASAAPLTADPPPEEQAPAHIRDDLDDPVLQFEAETDIGRGFWAARQPDTDMLRTWEVVGTAHADQSILDSTGDLAEAFGLDLSEICPVINDGPMAEVLRAAFDALRAWVVDGVPAPEGEPIRDNDGVIVRDELGIARGGVRSPPVDAPIVVLSGEPVPNSSVICSLFGDMRDIPPAELRELYPTHDDYVEAVTTSAERAVADGFLRQAEADAYVAEARAAG